MASYRNNSVENRSLYQMNDNVAFTVQAPSPIHVNNHYKQETFQQTHNNQNLRFHLQSHNQQIETSNFHILSRHYLGQQQQQHQQHFQYQHQATRQHHMMNMNISSNIPLNASESIFICPRDKRWETTSHAVIIEKTAQLKLSIWQNLLMNIKSLKFVIYYWVENEICFLMLIKLLCQQFYFVKHRIMD